MAYDVTLVQFNGTSGGISTSVLTGFPIATPFSFMLTSMWVCLPVFPPSGVTSISCGGEFGSTFASSDRLIVALENSGVSFYRANFSGPVVGQRYNVLVSVDCTSNTVQVYVNDQPAVLTSGGFTGAGQLEQGSGLYIVDLGSSGGMFPAVADVWQEATPSFVDLSVAGNRRKFINADLSPVDLGADGSNPFGSSPPVFLTVPAAGVASDFQTNFGTGGAISGISGGVSLTLQAGGICTLPLAAPTGLACGSTVTSDSISPVWSSVAPPPDSYTLQYRIFGTSDWTQITGITDTTVTISGLAPGTSYEWQVAGVIADVTGPFSASAFCSTAGLPFMLLACNNGFTITEPAVKLYGFDHLIGMAVVGLLDGIPMSPVVVAADGSVTLPFAASDIKIGLAFLPQIQSPPLNAGNPTVQGRRKAISAVTVRVAASNGFQVGTNQPDGAAQSPPAVATAWGVSTPMTNDLPWSVQKQTYMAPSQNLVTKLVTGDLRIAVTADWDTPGQVAVQQPLPLPLNVLAVLPELLEGDITEQGYSGEERPQQRGDQRQQRQGPGTWMLKR